MSLANKQIYQISFCCLAFISLCSCKIFAKKEVVQPYNNYQPYYPQQVPQYYYPPQSYPTQNYYSPQPVPNSGYYNNYYEFPSQERYNDYDYY